MSRPLRILAPGAFYHVMARGNAKMNIYLDDDDRSRFLEILEEVVQDCDLECHAYCEMSNHYHVLVETHEANLSQAFRQLNGVYAQWWNRRHTRVGHVMQGRFKAQLVQADDYFLEACRYVVLNPVRGGLVAHVADWPWSSYGATVGSAPCPTFLTVDVVRGYFGVLQNCQAFIDAGLNESAVAAAIRSDVRVIGDEAFAAAFRSQIEHADRTEVPARERRIARRTLEDLFSVVSDKGLRNRRIREAREYHCYNVADIANHLGLHYSTVSRVAATRSRPASESLRERRHRQASARTKSDKQDLSPPKRAKFKT